MSDKQEFDNLVNSIDPDIKTKEVSDGFLVFCPSCDDETLLSFHIWTNGKHDIVCNKCDYRKLNG